MQKELHIIKHPADELCTNT